MCFVFYTKYGFDCNSTVMKYCSAFLRRPFCQAEEDDLLDNSFWGPWMAQLVEHPTPDLRIMSSSPTSGIQIT